MLVITAHMHPHGSPVASYEVMHATITNLGVTKGETGRCDYGAHILCRPSVERGIEGFEADVMATSHDERNGLAPLLSGLLGAACPIPFDAEPNYQVMARLTLKAMDEFDARLRGRS
jgi:hypothetical protein